MKAHNVGLTAEEWRAHVDFVVLMECVADLEVKEGDVMDSRDDWQVMFVSARNRREVRTLIKYLDKIYYVNNTFI